MTAQVSRTGSAPSLQESRIIRDNTNYDFRMALVHADQARRGLVSHGCELQAGTVQEIISELEEQWTLFKAEFGESKISELST